MRSHRALFVSASDELYRRDALLGKINIILHLASFVILLSLRVHYVRHVLGLCKSGYARTYVKVRFKCRASLQLVTWHR